MTGKMYDFGKFASDASSGAWFVMNLKTGWKEAGPFDTREQAAIAGGKLERSDPAKYPKNTLYVSLRDR